METMLHNCLFDQNGFTHFKQRPVIESKAVVTARYVNAV